MKNKIDQLDTKTNVLYVENIKNKDERKLILKELENIKKTIDGLSEDSITELKAAVEKASELISNFPEGTDIRQIYEIITGIHISDTDTAADSNQEIQKYIQNNKTILKSIDDLIKKLETNTNDLTNLKTSVPKDTNMNQVYQTITGDSTIEGGNTKMESFTNSSKNLIDSVVRLNNITENLNDADKIPNVQDLYTVITGEKTVSDAKNKLTNYAANETKNLITNTTPFSYNSTERSLNIENTNSVNINYNTNPITFSENGMKTTISKGEGKLSNTVSSESIVLALKPYGDNNDAKNKSELTYQKLNFYSSNPEISSLSSNEIVFTTGSQNPQTKINNKEINIKNDLNYLNLNTNQISLKLEKMNKEQIFNNVKDKIENSYGTSDIVDRSNSLITAEAVTSKFQEFDLKPFKLISEENSLKIYNSKLNSSYDFEFNYDPNGNVTITEGPVLNNIPSTSPLGAINAASQKLLVNDFVIYQDRFINDSDATPIPSIKRGIINYIVPDTKKQTSVPNRFRGKIENQTIYIGHGTEFKSFNEIKDIGSEYFTFKPSKISIQDSVENFLMQNIITDDSGEFNSKNQYFSLNFYYDLNQIYNKVLPEPASTKQYVSEYTNYIYNDYSILSDFKNFSFPCDLDFHNTEFAECIGLLFKNDYKIATNLSSNYVYPRNYIRKLLNINLNQNTTNFIGFIRNLDIEEITFTKNNTTAENNELTFTSVSVPSGFINNSRNLKIEDYIKKYGINKWNMADGFDSHNIFSLTGAYNFYGYSIFNGKNPENLKNIEILSKDPNNTDIIDFSLWNKTGSPLNAICYNTFESFMYNGRIKVPQITISSNNGYGMFMNSLISEVMNLNDIDVSKATNLSKMFLGCVNMDTIDIGKWDLSNVSSFNGFIDHCINLISLTINSKYIDLSNLENLSDFYGNPNEQSYPITIPFDLKLIFPGNKIYIPVSNTYMKETTDGNKYTLQTRNDTYKITEVSKSEYFDAADVNSRILTLRIVSHVIDTTQ